MALLQASLDRARDWGQCALNLAFPWPDTDAAEPVPIKSPMCRQCGEPFPALAVHEADFVCHHCQEIRWHFEWARAGYRAEGQVLEAIIGFKYRDEYYQRRPLVDWLTEAFDRHAVDQIWHGLVPIPLYHRRLRDRGFNQARELAAGLSEKRKVPVANALYRYRETQSQARLERSARLENMTDAFRLKQRFDVRGKNLLIIDDVCTTGATVNACAQVLAQAGAARLAVLTVARS